MGTIAQRLYYELEQRGLKGRMIAVEHLPELQRDIVGRRAQGLFDEGFYQERLSFFKFTPPDEGFTAASIITVAVPRPQTKVTFTWNDQTRALVLPPTYLSYSVIRRQVRDLLSELLSPEGYHVTVTTLPLKLLAVRSGLAAYGRNNICYVPGMGSFLQITGFYSDMPCEEDGWGEPRMVNRCQTCQACLAKCPTGAITAERFLLRAERCLVYHNERPANYPFPAWIDPSLHHCLMGCMLCQQYCPEDKPFLNWFGGNEEFSHAETALLLANTPKDRLPAETAQKLKRLELLDSLDILPRNLGVFFKSDTCCDESGQSL